MSKPKSTEDALISNIISGIDNVKGLDVSLLDLRDIENTVCSYFVVCTGSSNTHVNAIVSSIQKTVSKDLKEKPFHTEGNDNAEWVLIDYVNVIVHVFQKQIREYYNIEELWGDAKTTKIASNY
ncbi:MAG: ribosome silencing factor [Flavobacteriaceae bacterium TMED42]|jgi:ribosome-associated protein|nr:ribosome silencing factor [Flavobacteriaceae bacterium]OUX37621.1 MAG: ribosome silencing factor [Kiritimatiellaceae bacterium TMED266]RPG64312.1 MAG: ribosome silencing factor [Flavobacteriaceae bacterium TMED42]MDB2314261.1 ribosome silencing factor [Flavobacteriaceae bacterium]MDC0478963.1 ribosome silencing factor [Flavobacteriaceae bacterium]|tara:strand:- start:1611 stop:1982 length:372 start_codon:yes stop_codon:yes gene_type:complete